jgi:hypothetical protein
MSRFLGRCGLCFVFTLLLMSSASAQRVRPRRAASSVRPHIGAHLLYNFDAEDFGLGVQFSYPVARHLELYPSFDYYFQSPGTLWQLNGDVKYKFRDEHNWPYVGGGLAIKHASAFGFSNSDVGVNLLAGWETLIGQWIHPYGEARLTLDGGTAFQIDAGLNITVR